MITADSLLRLRPSVAFVPQGGNQYHFFQGNTRRSRFYQFQPDLALIIRMLDGSQTLAEISETNNVALEKLLQLADHLHERCLIEDVEVAARVGQSPWRRVLNFLADYFSSSELEEQFIRLTNTAVVVLGAGAVGSWVAVQLAQTGFKKFTLVDNDTVERSNLNRSLFSESDIGKLKTDALTKKLQSISTEILIDVQSSFITAPRHLKALLQQRSGQTIVVNCADSPSVDVTSAIVDSACKELRMPYVIAGGYNLHLSLIGMTVIPGETACYHCGRITLNERQAGDLEDLRKLNRPWRNIGNLAPLAAITASFAVNEVIRLALRSDKLKPQMLNRRGEFNFLTNELHFIELPPRKECGCHAER